jgi:hypothetical protein
MQNKKITIIMALVSIALFTGIAMLFIHSNYSNQNVEIKTEQEAKQEIENKVTIVEDSCILQIEGEDPDHRYALGHGIDVNTTENLIATCSVRNDSLNEIVASPNFKNFSISGEEIKQMKSPFGSIVFGGAKETMISLPIIKASEPQAYDAGLYLLDESGEEISNTVYFHYVIAGESAYVFDAILDKANYNDGDVAKITLSYGGSADRGEYNRLGGTKNKVLKAEVDILDEQKNSCLAEKNLSNLDVDKFSDVEIVLNINKKCNNPSTKVMLRGENDRVLYEKSTINNAKNK